MPSFGMYTADGKLVSWLHPAGAIVRAGDPVLEIETDKAMQEVVAPASGLLHHVLQVGAQLKEQMVIGYVLAQGEKPPAAKELDNRSAPPQAVELNAKSSSWIKATPAARRLASAKNIPLTSLRPSGPDGRIVEADVLNALAAQTASSFPWRIRERLPFTGIRRAIAERLAQSQNAAVALTLTREVSAKQLVELRTSYNQRIGASVPLDAFFIKFLAHALRERPELNVVVHNDELILLDEVNIGFAVAIPGGLNVPVIHEADTLSIVDIAGQVRELAERARTGQLKAAEIDGGTSTVTNLGGFGIDTFTPVLNPPQSTILGIGRIMPRPIFDNAEVRVQPSVWLSLTFDHRVIDGVGGAQLIDSIAQQMNDERGLNTLFDAR
jgi:pyruvate dehydrogenase E2 component (dihydrolipoamide acetyltransferase)